MKRKPKHRFSGLLSDETGIALIIVLVLLVLGSLTLLPVLAHMSTALKTGELYEEKTDKFYAADAGIEDAIWQIKYNGLESLFGHENYNYDFSTNGQYALQDTINGMSVNVSIENVWFPTNVTLDSLSVSPAEAKEFIERPITDNNTNRLIVTGTPMDEDTYRIKIDFYPGESETNSLLVDSVGIWIPHGFTYAGSCTITSFPACASNVTESISDSPGGQGIVWEFIPGPILFTDLPDENLDPGDFPQSSIIEFQYTADDPTTRPAAVAWIVTAGPISSDIPISWDIDTRMYKITSQAGDTMIEGYASRCELRNMYAATPGDYVATGNSLLTDKNGDTYGIREFPLATSNATISSIPDDGYVSHAYLYWSGFYDSGFSSPDYWGIDYCSNFNNWDGPTRYWGINGGQRFCGMDYGSGTDSRTLEITDPIDLSSCPSGSTIVEWEHWESWWDNLEEDGAYADSLKFRFSSDNGSTWGPYETAFTGDLGSSMIYYYYVIPDEYLTAEFKIQFYLDGFTSSGEYVYIDNIAVAQITGTPDTDAGFTISGNTTHSETIYALESQVMGNKFKGQYSYTCWQDVTDLVKTHSELGSNNNHTGNGVYTVGGSDAVNRVDGDPDEHLSYAGWSIIVIYHSEQTAGRQLYLWNNFSYCQGGENLDFDDDGEPGGLIKGFIIPEQVGDDPVAAKLTCFVGEGDEYWEPDYLIFNDKKLWDGVTAKNNTQAAPNNVWNGESVNMYNGIDIDTFTITWSDGILFADDTEAQIDLISDEDNFNLIYMILSVRSETVIGGTKHYVISSE